MYGQITESLSCAPESGGSSVRTATELRAISEWIGELFETQFLNSDGLISRTYPPTSRTILDNFDDIAPFLLYFNRSKLLLHQLERLNLESFENSLPIGGVLYSYKIDEYLGGLDAIYKKTGSQSALKILVDAVDKSLNYFLGQDGNFAETFDLVRQERSPYFAPWSAGLLETYLDLDYINSELLDTVSNVMTSWVEHPFFKTQGLFPFRGTFSPFRNRLDAMLAASGRWSQEPPSRGEDGIGFKSALKRNPAVYSFRLLQNRYFRSGQWSQVMKSNTTPVFTLIELYRRTGHSKWAGAIERWIDAATSKFVRPAGHVLSAWYPSSTQGGPTLVAGFILIDVLCDAFVALGGNRRWLDIAQKICDAYLAGAWGNGLIPMSPGAQKNHIDGQVDFSISMRRVGELTGRNDLRDRSFELMSAALYWHQTPEGFCTHVDSAGKPVRLPCNTVDPKYNGLLLKGLIHLLESERRIYESPDLMDLFKDR